MGSRPQPNDSKSRHVLVNRNCLALVLRQTSTDSLLNRKHGHELYSDFLRQNSACFWNACLTRSVSSLEYRGHLFPATLLISGSAFALEAVRSAWARRVLRAPKGYVIDKLGEVGGVEMVPVPQTHFAPLSEALCKCVSDLNEEGRPATAQSIRLSLRSHFPEMQPPREDILHRTLGGLIQERKLCHTGEGYYVVSPDTYRQQPLCERQMLMTNEEAILRLHADRGSSMGVQVDEMDIWTSLLHTDQNTATQSTEVAPSSPNSLKLTGQRCGFNESMKGEKQSMFTKILKRMQSLKKQQVVFSAQFPPLDWSSSSCDVVQRYHSVASQTLLHAIAVTPFVQSLQPTTSVDNSQNIVSQKSNPQYLCPKTSYKKLNSDEWSPRKCTSLTRQNYSKNLMLHRHYGTLPNHSKRRQRHQRSSGEIPKAHKNLLNDYQSHSTSSKSNVENSDDKYGRSSSSGSALTTPLRKSKATTRGKAEQIKSCQSKKDNTLDSPLNNPRNCQNGKDTEESCAKPSTTTVTPQSDTTAEIKGLDKNVLSKNKSLDSAISPTKKFNSTSDGGFKDCGMIQSGVMIKPLILKNLVDMPMAKPALKEIIIDNTVSIEIATKSKAPTTTVVTEETTVTKGTGNSKTVTVTSITTNLSSNGGSDSSSDKEKSSVNDLNIVTEKNVDCSSTCNIVTGVK